MSASSWKALGRVIVVLVGAALVVLAALLVVQRF
jgi:hypothetical protein